MEATKNPLAPKTRPPPQIRKVKDAEPDTKFNDIHENLPQMPSLLLIIGSVRSGKSNLITNLFCNPDFYKDKFEIVRIISTTFALVLDDVLTKDFSKNNEVSFFATRFRHYIDLYVIATQTFRAVSGLIRNNATDVVICRQQNSAELGKIAEEYGGNVGGDDSFMAMYKDIHKEPFQIMYIKMSTNPAQVFRNFEEQIYPSAQYPEKSGFE